METILIDVKGVAEILSCSTRSVWRMADGGRCPNPVRPGGGGMVRWRKADIEAWVAAGCPDVRRTGWTPSVAVAGGCSGKGGCCHETR